MADVSWGYTAISATAGPGGTVVSATEISHPWGLGAAFYGGNDFTVSGAPSHRIYPVGIRAPSLDCEAGGGGQVTKHYLLGGRRVASRQGCRGELIYFFHDHPSTGSGQAWAAPAWR